jgi:hypothetical protein
MTEYNGNRNMNSLLLRCLKMSLSFSLLYIELQPLEVVSSLSSSLNPDVIYLKLCTPQKLLVYISIYTQPYNLHLK